MVIDPHEEVVVALMPGSRRDEAISRNGKRITALEVRVIELEYELKTLKERLERLDKEMS